VLLRGSELYRAEAKNQETLAKFGHNTPDDWIERNLYTRYSWQGVGLMLIIDLLLFGAIGAAVWAVQMLWIPITAAGIINGIGHFWGYRNFEAPDASHQHLALGHRHRRRGAAQQPPHLPDLGQAVGQAVRVRHRLAVHPHPGDAGPGHRAHAPPPQLQPGRRARQWPTASSLEAAHRQPLRGDGQLRQGPAPAPWAASSTASRRRARRARRASPTCAWRGAGCTRDADQHARRRAAAAGRGRARRARALAKLVAMREELRQLWTRTNVSAEQLVADLQAWCRKAEDSGIASLREFSLSLRAAQA
jgi:stearoyl-CoA desaturase (delta-9 desaturase)